MNFLITLALLLLSIYVIAFKTAEPLQLKTTKEKYQELRQYIKNNKNSVDKKFHSLENEILISGFTNEKWFPNDSIGYNVNKGYEIGLCIDGEANEMFHVLIHELAHSVTSAYSHDTEFWANYKKLRTICEAAGVYTQISEKTKFCGKKIGE
jgi:predicted metal-dependent hydrolase